MTQHNPAIRLRHMLDYAREAVEMVRGRARADLDSDRQLNLSLVRLLEMIGEAAGRVPPGEREQRPGIPWADIVGLRNRLVHGYDGEAFLRVLPSRLCHGGLWRRLASPARPWRAQFLVAIGRGVLYNVAVMFGARPFCGRVTLNMGLLSGDSLGLV